MKAEANVHQKLNQVLRCELAQINQHFLHARMQKNWGYDALGKILYQQAICAMKHADVLIERIFFLEGLPNLKTFDKLSIGQDVREALSCEQRAVRDQHKVQRQAIRHCEEVGDYVSRQLLDGQLADTEKHLDWLEEQITQIKEIGLANFLQSAVASQDDD